MDDPGGVRRGKRAGQVAGNRQNRRFRQSLAVTEQIGERERARLGDGGIESGRVWTAPDFVAEAHDFRRRKQQRPRHEKRDARGRIDAGAQHGQDRRMIKRGEGGGFALEAPKPRGAPRRLHRLQRDVAAGRVLARKPDGAHATLAERPQEREVPGQAHAGAQRRRATGIWVESGFRFAGRAARGPYRNGIGVESGSNLFHRASCCSAASSASRRSSAERRP